MADDRRRTDIRFNMAPMIDVVFLLIIFFVLVSTFASAENIPMDLPNPDKSQAKNVKITDRVVINCQLASSLIRGESGVLYSIGPNRPESLETISQRLAAAKLVNPDLKVIVRADKRLHYDQVRAVMEVVAENEIENLSLVAHVGLGEK